MEVSVRGKNGILSKKEIRYIVRFFGNIILGKRLADNIYVEIQSQPMTWIEMGFCSPFDYERNPREFLIELNNSHPRNAQIETLAHEMVHVKQMARNEWKIYTDEIHSWMGKKMHLPESKYQKKYFKLPWEKEAFLSEPWLCRFYEQHCKNNNLIW
jgi:hypothetical protein